MSKKPNHLVFITFDSCRYDSFMAANTPNISRLGAAQRCYSYASWTFPSHAAYLMGMLPHSSPKNVFASEVYKKEYLNWSARLGIEDISFAGFLPELSLPAFLRRQGYQTHALVSLPVLNQRTILNAHFDSYRLMPAHNDFRSIIRAMSFEFEQPQFYFINVGETHYPYTLPGESAPELPLIHGVHGVLKRMDDSALSGAPPVQEFFDDVILQSMKLKQQSNVEYLDAAFLELYDRLPKNTHLIVTADHGELFGEDGYFGHGPIFHEKVFEIFLVEGGLHKLL